MGRCRLLKVAPSVSFHIKESDVNYLLFLHKTLHLLFIKFEVFKHKGYE